jgi:photosystem II stability/assembly factor-like uncharacterized protein
MLIQSQNLMKKTFTINNLTSLLFYFSILIFLIGFNFTDSPPSGWYQQWMPTGLPNFQVSDVFFIDSLTGWAVTGNNNPNDTSGYILKTTNGGDNWTLKFTDIRDFSRVKFINYSTGFVSGGYYDGARLYKTINGGDNWINIYNLSQIYLNDMNVLNNDTIWVVNSNSLEGGVYRTTNGGQNWDRQLNLGSQNPTKIYMYNGNIGFIAKNTGSAYIRKTTNGGLNWDTIINGEGFVDMYFTDAQTGWKSYSTMQKTTNSGLNWINQTLPQGGIIILSQVKDFSNINSDTIWGGGGFVIYPNSQARSILYRTINGGNNWLFQIPDTSIHSGEYSDIEFIDRLKGWAYWPSSGVHTITGGDPVFYTGTKQISWNTPNEFKLFQNYPNPFNPLTTIRFKVETSADIKINIYDIQGKVINTLINKKFNAGEYRIKFNGNNISSGIYFYSLFIDNILIETKKMILIK